MKLTHEQKLLALLLCEIHQKLDIEDGLDSTFIRKALTGGHDWALSHELIGSIIPVEPDAEQTKNSLLMCWICIHSYKKLVPTLLKVTLLSLKNSLGGEIVLFTLEGLMETTRESIWESLVS